jgi:hypothetical protein
MVPGAPSGSQWAMPLPHHGEMTDVPQAAERDALAARLHAAWERLAASDLPAEQRSRLQRQLIAVCDAMKAPGASAEAGQRRLDGFLGLLNGIASEKSGYKS